MIPEYIKNERTYLPTIFNIRALFSSNGTMGKIVFIGLFPFVFLILSMWTVCYLIQGKGDF